MRDILLIYDENNIVDIDIVNGEPRYVLEEQNTQDQRAAVAAYMTKGTIPGMLDTGVDWSSLYSHDKSLIDIDNQIKRQITAFAVGNTGTGFSPVYRSNKGRLEVGVFKAGS